MSILSHIKSRGEELRDIHSSFRVLMHGTVGFPQKGETAGSMTDKLIPHIESFLREDRILLLESVRNMIEEEKEEIANQASMDTDGLATEESVAQVKALHVISSRLSQAIEEVKKETT